MSRTGDTPAKLYIEVTEGEDRGRIIALVRRRIPLGRLFAPGEIKPPWILFADPSVERLHAILDWDPQADKFLFLHKASRSHSLINGEAREHGYLSPGDSVQMGGLIFTITDTLQPEKARLCEPLSTEPPEESGKEPPAPFTIVVEPVFITTREEDPPRDRECRETGNAHPSAREDERGGKGLLSPRSGREDDDTKRERKLGEHESSYTFMKPRPTGRKQEEAPVIIPDYYLISVKGPYKGTRLPIFSVFLEEGKSFWISCPKPDSKSLEITERDPGSSLFSLVYSGNIFSFLPTGSRQFKINNSAAHGQVPLKTGDIIAGEDLYLIFIEHQLLEELSEWEFVVIKGNRKDIEKRFSITREQISMGRSKSSDIRLTDKEVALHQATIQYFMGRFFYTQRSRSSITYFRYTPLSSGQQKILSPDDIVTISSRTSLLFRKKAVPGELYELFAEK